MKIRRAGGSGRPIGHPGKKDARGEDRRRPVDAHLIFPRIAAARVPGNYESAMDCEGYPATMNMEAMSQF